MLVGIGNHNGALGRPEQAGADAQEHAGKDVEARDIGVDRGEQAGGVDAVADASKGEGVLDAELVDKGAAEETKDGKRAVQGRVLCNATTVSNRGFGQRSIRQYCGWSRINSAYHVVGEGRVGFAASSHAAQGVEHAGAQEADKRHHDELGLGRGVPRDVEAKDPALLVFPSRGEGDVDVSIGGSGSGWTMVDSLVGRHGGVGGLLLCRHCWPSTRVN